MTGRDRFGVLVGRRHGRSLRFLGTVERGYNRASVAQLTERAAPLTRSSSPFVDRPSRRGVTWLTTNFTASR